MEMPHVARLNWDDWNREHILRHRVLPEEAEEVIAADIVICFDSYKERVVVIGQTSAGRALAVVIGPVPHEQDVYYVFSARPASPREPRQYKELRKGAGQ